AVFKRERCIGGVKAVSVTGRIKASSMHRRAAEQTAAAQAAAARAELMAVIVGARLRRRPAGVRAADALGPQRQHLALGAPELGLSELDRRWQERGEDLLQSLHKHRMGAAERPFIGKRQE